MDVTASRFTVQGNTVPPGTRGYDPALCMQVEKLCVEPGRSDDWYINAGGEYWNFASQRWVDEYQFRHSDDGRAGFLTTLEAALAAAQAHIETDAAGEGDGWRRVMRPNRAPEGAGA